MTNQESYELIEPILKLDEYQREAIYKTLQNDCGFSDYHISVIKNYVMWTEFIFDRERYDAMKKLLAMCFTRSSQLETKKNPGVNSPGFFSKFLRFLSGHCRTFGLSYNQDKERPRRATQ